MDTPEIDGLKMACADLRADRIELRARLAAAEARADRLAEHLESLARDTQEEWDVTGGYICGVCNQITATEGHREGCAVQSARAALAEYDAQQPAPVVTERERRLAEALRDVGGQDATGDRICWCDGGPEHAPECDDARTALAAYDAAVRGEDATRG